MKKFDLAFFSSINKVISDLYNVDLPVHNRILHFYNALLEFVYFDKATIFFFYKDSNDLYQKHSSIGVKWIQENIKKYDEYYCSNDYTLPILDQTTPIVFRATKFFDQAAVENTPYYSGYLVPNNCIYSVEGNLQLKNDMELRGGFCFYRGREKSDFTEAEEEIIKIFQPHLSNVLRDYTNASNTDGIIYSLDGIISIGIGYMDSNYSVIRCNQAFSRLINTTDPNENKVNVIFNKAKQLCRSLEDDNVPTKTYELKIDDEPIIIEVARIVQGDGAHIAKYCCLIYDLSYFFSQAVNKAKDRYNLTTRELEIIKYILRGYSNEQIAKELYLSIPTIKNCLVSAYSKFGINSQKQILEKLRIL